jgi:hypothetical protein
MIKTQCKLDNPLQGTGSFYFENTETGTKCTCSTFEQHLHNLAKEFHQELISLINSCSDLSSTSSDICTPFAKLITATNEIADAIYGDCADEYHI